jgi:preprotein translocase subunit SecA
MNNAVAATFGYDPGFEPEDGLSAEGLTNEVAEAALKHYEQKFELYGQETMDYLERMILLQVVDGLWKDHLLNMDHLKEGIGLRGYGQKDPLREYQREGFDMFADMVERIKAETISTLMRLQIQREDDVEAFAPEEDPALSFSGGEESAPQPVQRKGGKIGRNDPCPCGSGKKYKKCCGRN